MQIKFLSQKESGERKENTSFVRTDINHMLLRLQKIPRASHSYWEVIERRLLYEHFYNIVKGEKKYLMFVYFSMPASFSCIKVESANVIQIN